MNQCSILYIQNFKRWKNRRQSDLRRVAWCRQKEQTYVYEYIRVECVWIKVDSSPDSNPFFWFGKLIQTPFKYLNLNPLFSCWTNDYDSDLNPKKIDSCSTLVYIILPWSATSTPIKLTLGSELLCLNEPYFSYFLSRMLLWSMFCKKYPLQLSFIWSQVSLPFSRNFCKKIKRNGWFYILW